MQALVLGLFGLVVGSFLNVVILRRSVRGLGGRSVCMSCGASIRWYDLVPVISWIALGGRCRACGSRISVQYPFVEAMTGTAFALIGGSNANLSAMVFALPIISLLICIAVYDLRHTIIPDEWVWSFNGLGLFSTLMSPHLYPVPYEILFGPLAALPLFLLWLVSKGRWMGLGDAKLALGIGWLLGPAGAIAVFGAFVLGTVTLVPAMVCTRAVTHSVGWARRFSTLTMKSEVPFGPFLIASMCIVWILDMYGIDSFSIFLV